MTRRAEEPLNLGQIIDALEAAISQSDEPADNSYVHFDFGNAVPDGFSSYRGYYDQLGLCFTGEYGGVFADQFLKYCKDAIGKTFKGWKGGDFKMSRHTDVWVACSGNTSETRVTGIHVELDSFIVIDTANFNE